MTSSLTLRPASRCYIQRVVHAVVVDVLCLLTELGPMTELLCLFFWTEN